MEGHHDDDQSESGDQKPMMMSVKPPDPCLLCGTPAVHYDWEGKVIKRESPSRLLVGDDGGSGGGGDSYSDLLVTAVFRCFRIPRNSQRVGKAEADALLPASCESCEELVALLLDMYGKVEELEEKLKKRVRGAEEKFVEEGLYEKHGEIYGTFRTVLLASKRKQEILGQKIKMGLKRRRRMQLSQKDLKTATATGVKVTKRVITGGTSRLPSSKKGSASTVKFSRTHHHPALNESTKTANAGESMTSVGNPDLASITEHEPHPSASILTKLQRQQRRKSPRTTRQSLNKNYAEESISGGSEQVDDMRSDADFNFDDDDNDSGADGDSDVGGSKSDTGNNNNNNKDEIMEVESERASNKAEVIKAQIAGIITRNIILTKKETKEEAIARKKALKKSRKPPPSQPSTDKKLFYYSGVCSVCDRPFESTRRNEYYAHRMSHLSEAEKAVALSNPCRYGRRGKLRRPRIPRVSVKRKITPELASLRGDVNQCPSCGKLISGGPFFLARHEKLHLPNRGRTLHCSVCGASKGTKQALAIHMARVHHSSSDADAKLPPPQRRWREPLPSLRREGATTSLGICPVCFKPFDSILTSEYYDHRLTHLSEAERQEATSNPIKLAGGKRTRPRLPRIEDKMKMKITPELASLRGDVNQCPTCGKFIAGGSSGMDHHAKTHLPPEEKRSHLCSTCGKAYCRKGALNFHTRTAHPDEVTNTNQSEEGAASGQKKTLIVPLPFPCSQCNKSFTLPKTLERHLLYRHAKLGGQDFNCKYFNCKQSFATQEARLEHYIQGHPNSKTARNSSSKSMRCLFPSCTTTHGFPDEASLAGHVAQEHAAQAQSSSSSSSKGFFMCYKCGKVLVNDWNLKQHHLTHSSEEERRNYACLHCTATFTTKPAWVAHMGSLHDEGPAGGSYKCEQPGCERVCRGRRAFFQHMRQIHGIYEGRRRRQ